MPGWCVGIEQIEHRGEGTVEIDKPVLVGPSRHVSFTPGAKEKVWRVPGHDRLLGSVEDLVLLRLNEFELLAGLLLERGDNLRDCFIFLGVKSFLPHTTRSAARAPSAAMARAAARTMASLRMMSPPRSDIALRSILIDLARPRCPKQARSRAARRRTF
jgi:hypothetical protein